jgi:aspartyl-tRNA(Asn)/glutamyl-tRNA(Gln) amidotransferase subunit C
MKIDTKTIEKMAYLSRIELSQNEKENLAEEAEKILEWMDKLNELDTSEIEPLYHIHNNKNTMREDKSMNTLSRDEALYNSPVKDQKYFKVPKVIE